MEHSQLSGGKLDLLYEILEMDWTSILELGNPEETGVPLPSPRASKVSIR